MAQPGPHHFPSEGRSPEEIKKEQDSQEKPSLTISYALLFHLRAVRLSRLGIKHAPDAETV